MSVTAHPTIELKDAAGTTHKIEYRLYEMNEKQQFAVLGINRNTIPIEAEEVPGYDYTFLGKLDQQDAIFQQRTRNSLQCQGWDFDRWSNPEILLITKKI